MAEKNNVQVIINGNVFTLSGSESEEYLQKVALYINNKINDLKLMDSYRKLSTEYQDILLALNLADDYFKKMDQIHELKIELENKDKQVYEMKHGMIDSQIRLETAQKLNEEYKEKINELQMKILQLSTERDTL